MTYPTADTARLRSVYSYNSRTSRTPSSTAPRSSGDNSPKRRSSRSWSVTATTLCPSQQTRTNKGKLGCGEVERGTTTTLRRNLLKILSDRMMQDRIFAISEPRVGSRRTHQIAPRRSSTTVLAQRRKYPPKCRKSSRYREHQRTCLQSRSSDEIFLSFAKLFSYVCRNILRPEAGRNTSHELRANSCESERQFPASHTAIPPYRLSDCCAGLKTAFINPFIPMNAICSFLRASIHMCGNLGFRPHGSGNPHISAHPLIKGTKTMSERSDAARLPVYCGPRT